MMTREPTAAGERFLVTAAVPTDQSPVWSQVWDTADPLALGRPFRWSLERTADGIRVRKLDAAPDSVLCDASIEVSLSKLPGTVIPLGGVCLRVQPLEPHALPSATEKFRWSPVTEAAGARKENRTFWLLFANALLCGGLLYFLNLRVHQEPEKELIPAQFAKTILTPAYRQKIDEARARSPVVSRVSPIDALKGKALQKSLRQLLANTPLAEGSGAEGALGRARKREQLFAADARNPLATPHAADVDIPTGGVGLLGNRDVADDKAGYRGGKVASVKGQGSSTFDLAAPEEMTVQRGLTKDEVGRAIQQHLGEIRYCYSAALARNPGAEGKLLVDFRIGPSGDIKSLKPRTGTTEETLNRCILDHMVRWKFPKPEGGVDVDVSYPFIFKMLGP